MARNLTSNYGIVARKVVGNPNLSHGARNLYSILATFADKDTGLCYPGDRTLSELTGSDRSQLNKWFKELEQYDYIERRTRNKNVGARQRTIFLKDGD